MDVTIVEALPRLVPNEDEFLSKQLERAFRRLPLDQRAVFVLHHHAASSQVDQFSGDL